MQTPASSGVPVHHVLWWAAGSPKGLGYSTATGSQFALEDRGPFQQVPNIAASTQGFFICPVTMVCRTTVTHRPFIQADIIYSLCFQRHWGLMVITDSTAAETSYTTLNYLILLIWKKTWIDPSLHNEKANNPQNLNSLERKDNPAALLKTLITDSRSLGHFTELLLQTTE